MRHCDVQLIAGRGSPTRSELTALLERPPGPILDSLDEADFLRMVHIKYRYLDVQGRRVRYLDQGVGHPLLLCHGFIGSLENFHSWSPAFSGLRRHTDCGRSAARSAGACPRA